MNARYPFTNEHDVSIEFYRNLPSAGGSWKPEPRLLYLME